MHSLDIGGRTKILIDSHIPATESCELEIDNCSACLEEANVELLPVSIAELRCNVTATVVVDFAGRKAGAVGS